MFPPKAKHKAQWPQGQGSATYPRARQSQPAPSTGQRRMLHFPCRWQLTAAQAPSAPEQPNPRLAPETHSLGSEHGIALLELWEDVSWRKKAALTAGRQVLEATGSPVPQLPCPLDHGRGSAPRVSMERDL